MRGYVGADGGYRRRVLRCVSLAALVVVATGCGGASRPPTSVGHGVPRALARAWAGQAAEIATAAAAGDDCRATELANVLQADVIAKAHKLPLRLRSPLVTGVTSLAGRLTCRTTVTVETTPSKPPGKHEGKHGPPSHPPHKDHHKHGGDG
jgi:hypothetical protein